jgi:DNA-binding CsgD family transcriptional regulator
MSRAKLPVYSRKMPVLTPRETEIAHLMAMLMSPAAIAKRLGIRHQVAKNYMHRVREKLSWAAQ